MANAVARTRSVILALGAGPSGFPKQFSGRRLKRLRQRSSRSLPLFWRWGVARRASQNKFPNDAKRGSWAPTAMANPRRRTRALRYFGAGVWPVGLPETIFRAKLPRQPWQTRAVARARSVILALGSGPSGFPKQCSGRSFRDSHGKPAPSLAHAPLFWRWGAGPTGCPKQISERCKAGGSWRSLLHMRPKAYVATRPAQIIKGEDHQWPQWLFYQPEADKWPDL